MRFTLFGFPVHVQPMFWLMSFLLARFDFRDPESTTRGIAWMAVIFVSILVHELGHAFAMRRVGRAASIALVGMGGETRWGEGPSVSPRQAAFVSVAGPLAGLTFAVPFAALLFSGIAPDEGLAADVLTMAVYVNGYWSLVNLLPILPMDGGKLSVVALHEAFGTRGVRAAQALSLLLGACALAIAFRTRSSWLIFLSVMSMVASFRSLRRPAEEPSIPAFSGPSVDPATQLVADAAWDLLFAGKAEAALELCASRLAALGPEDAAARAELLEMRVWAHLDLGDEQAAMTTAREMPEGFMPSALMSARLRIAAGEVDEGLEELKAAYEESPGDHAAMVTAAAFLDAGRPDDALAVLHGTRGAAVGPHGHGVVSAALFHAGHPAKALEACELSFERFHRASAALDAARCLARLGRVEDGLGWLERFVECDDAVGTDLEAAPDLEPLRTEPRFAALAGALATKRAR